MFHGNYTEFGSLKHAENTENYGAAVQLYIYTNMQISNSVCIAGCLSLLSLMETVSSLLNNVSDTYVYMPCSAQFGCGKPIVDTMSVIHTQCSQKRYRFPL